MYQTLQLPPVHIRRQIHWLQFIFKCIYFNYPQYLKQYLIQLTPNYQNRHATKLYFSVPRTSHQTGRKAVMFKALDYWNHLHRWLLDQF